MLCVFCRAFRHPSARKILFFVLQGIHHRPATKNCARMHLQTTEAVKACPLYFVFTHPTPMASATKFVDYMVSDPRAGTPTIDICAACKLDHCSLFRLSFTWRALPPKVLMLVGRTHRQPGEGRDCRAQRHLWPGARRMVKWRNQMCPCQLSPILFRPKAESLGSSAQRVILKRC